MSGTIEDKTGQSAIVHFDLAHNQIERQTLERAALRIEALAGNPTYEQAWRLAARAIRSMKRD